ncbi:zeta toxin family protein [Nocardia vinacea]|uniref:zeta toxin family protein n=1 Tax=Nocardia vinacea TaxID=96468 RepID=UPI0033EB3629
MKMNKIGNLLPEVRLRLQDAILTAGTQIMRKNKAIASAVMQVERFKHADTFGRVVLETLRNAPDGRLLHSVDRPTFVMVSAQPGAGKTTAVHDILTSFADRGGAARVAGDSYRKYHPRYEKILSENAVTTGRPFLPDTFVLRSMALDYAMKNRFNIAYESAGGMSARGELDKVKKAIADNYRSEFVGIAVPDEESSLSSIIRCVDQWLESGSGRYVSLDVQKNASASVSRFIRNLESDNPTVPVDQMTIRSRTDVLYTNERLSTGEWAKDDPEGAWNAFEAERNRPPSTEERIAFIERTAETRRTLESAIDSTAAESPAKSAQLRSLLSDLNQVVEQSQPWLARTE